MKIYAFTEKNLSIMAAKTWTVLLLLVGVFQVDCQMGEEGEVIDTPITNETLPNEPSLPTEPGPIESQTGIVDNPPEEEPTPITIEPGKTFSFESRENFTQIVKCSFEYVHPCNWACLPVEVKLESKRIIPELGSFTFIVEDSDTVVKNKHKNEIVCFTAETSNQ